MKPRKVKPNGDALAELEADVTGRFEQGEELGAKHAQQRIDLEVRQRDQLLQLETRHKRELAGLEARQLLELAALWRNQRRKLGPGLLRKLGELAGWKGEANGKAG